MTELKILQEFENFYDQFLSAQEKSTEAFAWFSGIPHPLFNAVMHLQTDSQAEEKLDNLISLAPKNVPISFWAHSQNKPSNLKDVLTQKGFQLIGICPLMSWSVQLVSETNHQIKPAEIITFHNILQTAYTFDNVVKEGFSKLLENTKAENYLIYKNEQPIGTGTLIVNGKVGGIFNAATLPEYQKRGYGRAMMEFLMNRAANLGLERLILLSSPFAEKHYTSLGFTKHLDIEIYTKF